MTFFVFTLLLESSLTFTHFIFDQIFSFRKQKCKIVDRKNKKLQNVQPFEKEFDSIITKSDLNHLN